MKSYDTRKHATRFNAIAAPHINAMPYSKHGQTNLL